jgi:ABC-type polysaccharide/polyol phosphate transport system ATPase subunit
MKSYSIKKNFLQFNKNKKEDFEAVKNVSFTVYKGEILGIVGKNGSGKSTMLRALAGIFSPDEGSIDLCGNSISLLSIGVGFQKELSGRENIVLSGMLLGFSEEEIREKMPRIIKFSGLGKFIDMPVRTYSSGMFSKLAFSITVILETDIMLVDEVLSVGDQRFKRKSYNKMKSLIEDENRTVVIVSHSLETLRKLCGKILWINDGEFMMIGETEEVLEKYEAFMEEDAD